MPTFGEWEATVLEETYDLVDYVSLHTYYEQIGDDRDSFLARAVDFDNFIDAVVGTCDHVRAKNGHRKHINLAVDEWNIWYQSRFAGEENLDWAQAPRLIEDTYSVTDAVVLGDLLITLLRHADRVKIGCLAQLVNVIAPIRSEPGGPAWRQATFHPFALTSRHGRGTVLRTDAVAPTHETAAQGEVSVLAAVTLRDDESGEVTLFAVNRDQRQALTLDLDLRACPGLVVGKHTAVYDSDPEAANTAERPDRVAPRPLGDVKVSGGRATVVLPALSWSMIRLLGDR
jgi:alpha-N-arabinofuranosidase